MLHVYSELVGELIVVILDPSCQTLHLYRPGEWNMANLILDLKISIWKCIHYSY